MDQTLEVRWFQSGAPPAAVTDWFDTLNAPPDTKREDLYLFTEKSSVNVKLRESKIQTKRRLGAQEEIQFHPNVTGVREHWYKWSFPTKSSAPDLFSNDPTGLWMPVYKTRYQREFEPDEQLDLLDDPIEPNPVEAAVELTYITSGDHEAWTVCVEAEGHTEALLGTLQQMGQWIFAQGTAPELTAKSSYGYVAWLRTLPIDLAQQHLDGQETLKEG